MQKQIDEFHEFSRYAEHGSRANEMTVKAYESAVHDHIKKKFMQAFRLMDAEGKPDYCNTDLHRDCVDLLDRMMKDPNHGKYVWLTLNWDLEKPSVADLEDLKDNILHVLAEEPYFTGDIYGRFELFTEKGRHTHCHILTKSSGKRSVSDLKKHLLCKKVAKSLGLKDVNFIKIGDKRGKIMFPREDKIDYLRGHKQDAKKPSVAADKDYFESIGFPQYFTTVKDFAVAPASEEIDLTTPEGPNVLVGPDLPASDIETEFVSARALLEFRERAVRGNPSSDALSEAVCGSTETYDETFDRLPSYYCSPASAVSQEHSEED